MAREEVAREEDELVPTQQRAVLSLEGDPTVALLVVKRPLQPLHKQQDGPLLDETCG